MKLNGWQRLWFVISILWIGAILVHIYIGKRSEAEIYHSWSQALLSYLVTNGDDLRNYSVKSLRSTYSDISDKELVEALHKKYIGKHPAYRYGFSQIDTKYENALSDGQDGRLKTLLYLAIGIPIAFYLLGWAMAWVRRGFKHT